MKTTGLIGSIAGAAALGALVSALFTPDGAQTRRKISNFVRDLGGKLPTGVQDYLGLTKQQGNAAATTANLSRQGVRATTLHS